MPLLPPSHRRRTLPASAARTPISTDAPKPVGKLAAAWWLAVPLLVLALVSPAFAGSSAVVVTTTEGRQLEGELIRETDNDIVLRISGIEARLDRTRIASIERRRTAEQIRQQRRAELDDNDFPGRYELAYELFERGAFDVALQETRALLADFPDAPGIKRLERVILQRRQMQGRIAGSTQLAAAGQPGQSRAAQRRDQVPRLSQSEINRIRVFEVDLDEEPRIHIPRATLNALIEQYAGRRGVPTDRGERGQFLRAPGHEQLALMFDLRAREYYGDVVVRDEPAPLTDFRRRIHTQHILNYCATNSCHGGEDAPGNLRLLRGTDTDTVYTNFYILHVYENDDGRMIDRNRPEDSLLLEYSLSRNAARTPHPNVPGWRARFPDRTHRTIEQYTETIDSLWRPRPDYDIDYHPPGMPEPEDDENDT